MSGFLKTIIFDLDDTLYDEYAFVESGFWTVATYLADRFGVDKQQGFSDMMAVLTSEGRGKVFDKVLEMYGLYNPNLVTELVNIYRSHLPKISLFPDVLPTFKALKEHGVKLGIITDGLHTVQRRKISTLGLAELVDMIIYTDELGQEYWKPSPFPFKQAISILDVKPENAVYVGNDPIKDIAGANSVGMFTVHICRNGIREKCNCGANIHISTLTEIVRVIIKKGGQH